MLVKFQLLTILKLHNNYFYNKGHKYSDAAVRSTTAAYKNCKELHTSVFCSLKHSDLQAVVDQCPLKHASLELIISLFHQMYQYALMNDLCEKDYSAGVKIKKEDDDEKGIPFTMEELTKICLNPAFFLPFLLFSACQILTFP